MFTYTNPRKSLPRSLQIQLHKIEQSPLTTNRKRKLFCIDNVDENISPSKVYDPEHDFPETSFNMNSTELTPTLSEKFESLISKSKNEQLCLSSIATAESSTSQLIEHNTITPLKSKNVKGVEYLSNDTFSSNKIQNNKADYEVKASSSYDYKDLVFGKIKDTNVVLKKRKLFNEFELDTENTSLTAPVSHKKTSFFDYGFCKNSVPKLQRSFSTNDATIKAAFEKEDNESNLIGDFSRSFILPLLTLGRHADLRSISSDTLAHLLEGAFNDCIDSYVIIDCRYPYEYEGGHIRGAINIFTKEQLFKDYTEDKLGKKSHKTDKINVKRNVLIFHCEFSSERGPRL
ncbi:M-phase inducer phosphatase 3-like isoform X2 [Metopolophium dirhodum]|nr:M-phase inducer phosphatase 3-like isoform X2 [Metopolophium dirhodum]